MPSTPGRRGRPPAFDEAALLDATVTVAERDGLDATTLKAVATELSITPMALYRLVDSKDDLFGRVPDHLVTRIEPGLAEAADGIAALRHVATHLGALLDEHPAVAPLFNRPAVGPTMGRLAAICIDKLGEQGADPARAGGLLRATVAMVVGLRITGGASAGSAIGPIADDAIEVWLDGVAAAIGAD